MRIRIILSSMFALALAGPAFAGPCTQRLADLEKSITAQQEGGGPALANPATTGSTAPSSSAAQDQPSGSGMPAQKPGSNEAMQMLQQAKQLDQQGKEAECMDMATRIGTMAPPATK